MSNQPNEIYVHIAISPQEKRSPLPATNPYPPQKAEDWERTLEFLRKNGLGHCIRGG